MALQLSVSCMPATVQCFFDYTRSAPLRSVVYASTYGMFRHRLRLSFVPAKAHSPPAPHSQVFSK